MLGKALLFRLWWGSMGESFRRQLEASQISPIRGAKLVAIG